MNRNISSSRQRTHALKALLIILPIMVAIAWSVRGRDIDWKLGISRFYEEIFRRLEQAGWLSPSLFLAKGEALGACVAPFASKELESQSIESLVAANSLPFFRVIEVGAPGPRFGSQRVVCRDQSGSNFKLSLETGVRFLLERALGKPISVLMQSGSVLVESENLSVTIGSNLARIRLLSKGKVRFQAGVNGDTLYLKLAEGSIVVEPELPRGSLARSSRIELWAFPKTEILSKESVLLKEGESGSFLPSGFHKDVQSVASPQK